MRQIVCWCLLLICTHAQAQVSDNRKIRNLEAFAKLYGYVQYFHPSDEADKLNWRGFAVYGAASVANAADEKELLKILQELFKPVAPTVEFFPRGYPISFDKRTITPPDTAGYFPVTWQHQGLGVNAPGNVYRSVRINRLPKDQGTTKIVSPSKPIFPGHPLPEHWAITELPDDIKALVPIALYGNKEQTYPAADKQLFDALQEKCNAALKGEFNTLSPEIKAAGVVVAWNALRHFFPYWEYASEKPDDMLRKALKNTFDDQTMQDYIRTLRLMTAPLNDGHVYVYHKEDTSQSYTLPLLLEFAEGKLVVDRVIGTALAGTVQPGDLVVKVDGVPTNQLVKDIQSLISGSQQYKNSVSKTEFFNGLRESTVRITFQRGEQIFDTTVHRRVTVGQLLYARNQRRPSGTVQPGIVYIDLNVLNMDSIKRRKDELFSAKGVIFDLRGYPKSNHEVITWLLRENDTAKWMYMPRITRPDYDRVQYQPLGWSMRPDKNNHLTSKVAFITSGRAISYAESFMGFIKAYDLATIVGEATAGANGNVNSIDLPGGYLVSWTGMLVKYHDGGQLFMKGIVPDVPVQRTIKGITEGRDEMLEKAIQIVSQ